MRTSASRFINNFTKQKHLPTSINHFHPSKLIQQLNTNHISFKNVCLFNRSTFLFCNNKFDKNQDNNKASEQKQEAKLSSNSEDNGDKNIVSEKEEIFNLFLGFDRNHSFKNELVVSQNKYKKEIKELKEAILFEDLLKKEIDILIYDTQGKPYYHHLLRCFLMAICLVGTVVAFDFSVKENKKFKVFMTKTFSGQLINAILCLIIIWLSYRIVKRHFQTTARFVEKIVYNTETENFTFTRRKLWGSKSLEEVSRFKVLYTENAALNKRGTNYINIDNLKEYGIIYDFAWKKEDLFSHLISQRIRT